LEIDFENVLIDQLFFSLFLFLGKQFDPRASVSGMSENMRNSGILYSVWLYQVRFPDYPNFFLPQSEPEMAVRLDFQLKCENALWIHSIESHGFSRFR
jgi:hypothetical protein